MKVIEFVCISNNKLFLLLMSVEDISLLEGSGNCCFLVTKRGERYSLVGNYSCLMSRWLYCLGKKNNFLDDKMLRPSLYLKYDPEKLEADPVLLDIEQIRGLIQVLDFKNFKKLQPDLLDALQMAP